MVKQVLSARTAAELDAMRGPLAGLKSSGLTLFPVGTGKVPRDKGWQTRAYSDAELKRWAARGGNIGVALGPGHVVMDVDPRNFEPGDDPFKRLCADIGATFGNAPVAFSGRGVGHHIYLRKPERLRIHGRLTTYKGLDFKSAGGFVLAPGSRHPVTGGLYAVDELGPPISKIPMAPQALLTLLSRPDPVDLVGGRRVGRITNEKLAELLAVLDPFDYGSGNYDGWIRIAAACHDATAGGGITEWLAWCEGDPAYANDEARERNIRHWQSFIAGQPGGVTYRTLLQAVSAAGRPDLVAGIDGEDDALEEDFLIHEFEDEEEPGNE